jgi:phosphoglucosamine mutase
MPRLFGTDGVRGIVGTELTRDLARRLGEAAGTLLGEGGRGRIVVGRDTRASGEMLEAALVEGICSAGCDALLAGIIPTPAVALLTRELGADGGVVISASHNPAEYNGIKFFSRDGFKLPDELEDDIEVRVSSPQLPVRPAGARAGVASAIDDAVERYVAHAVATVPEGLAGLKVALDCGHGAAAVSSETAFLRLGAEVVAANCDWNGTDINAGCGSTHLGSLVDLVRESGADLGIAHDGDADRALAVDETGAVVDGDRIMAVIAAQLRGESRLSHDMVVSTVMANIGFEVAMRDLGVSVVRTAVGDRYVLDGMRSVGATLGGEQSGHIIFLEHSTTGDGLVTALQLARVMRVTGKPLSVLASVMTCYPQVLVNVHVTNKGRAAASAAVAAAIATEERMLGDDGRVLVRSSGTEPLVRVMVEAADLRVAQGIAERLAAVVERESR